MWSFFMFLQLEFCWFLTFRTDKSCTHWRHFADRLAECFHLSWENSWRRINCEKVHVLFPWFVFNLCGHFPLVIYHDSAQVHIQHSFRRVMTQDIFGLWPSNTTRLGRCCALLLQNEPSPLRCWDDHGTLQLSLSSFFKLFWTQENRHTSAVCGF